MSDDLFTQAGEVVRRTPPKPGKEPTGLRDNHTRGRVIDFLSDEITPGSDLSFVSAYFTIYAYGALRSELERINTLRFLFGEPRFIKSLDPDKTDKKAFQIEDSQIKLSNRLTQKQLARECADWIERKVEIRSIKQSQLLHGKMYHIARGGQNEALLGSSNFTVSGIGASEKANLELNIKIDSKRDLEDLQEWFAELWMDESRVEDVKEEVLRYLAQIYVDHSPEFIYFKTLFHVFEKFLQDQANEDARFGNLEIVETEIWKALYDFQRDGVKGAINKIKAHNGCILADSVGLGKTYTALAVIKYFELRDSRVLVLCPKKLRENWTVYLAQSASEMNPFLKDKFNYTVLSHTDLSRESGKTGDIDLGNLHWSNFDLVVIDESHNFRNNTKGKRDEDGNVIKKSRYERLMEDIIQKGVQTRVLLLSATPVNNDLKDLRNQIYYITEGDDSSFADKFSITSIKEVLNQAQQEFKKWSKTEGQKDSRILMEKLPAGFFSLLDELTIARSRKHIKRYYTDSVKQLGDFPVRNKPDSIYADIDTKGEFMSYDVLNRQIESYQLALYSPFSYVKEEAKATYERKVGNFSQATRERFLIGMMRVNFLKRLESSIKSFEITMDRTVEKIEKLEARLQRFLQHEAGNEEFTGETPDETEVEDQDLTDAFEVGKIGYKMADLEVERWLEDLERDREQLAFLRDSAREVTPERDAKLQELKKRIETKVKKPSKNKLGEDVRKVLVFTAFADTAEYLYKNLVQWARSELGVHIAMVSGGAKENQTTFGKAEFNQILTNFSPRSKNRKNMASMPQDDEITILIATDCISEGQNLQDCDLLVNYDIHWNPVRIIQRFGRIDRIGSVNPHINLVNFWPTPDLNQYINLKSRVEARMALVDISATAEDNLLDPKELEDLIGSDLKYRDQQLLRLQKEILDLEDFQEAPSLSEFTLDDFRMELANYIQANKKILQEAPMGLYAVVPAYGLHHGLRPGVIFCLRQTGITEGTEVVNPLQPYYLIYVHDTGDVRFSFAQPKQILDLMRDLCAGKTEANTKLCDLFNERTENGTKMGHFTDLLERSIKSIVDQVRKRSAAELFKGRGAVIPKSSARAKSEEDFELITWLVIQEQA